MGRKIEGKSLVSINDQSLLKLFVHVLMKSITCKASNESNDIVASSTRDRNDAANKLYLFKSLKLMHHKV